MPNQVKIFDLRFDAEFRREFYQNCERVFDEAYLTDHTLVEQFQTVFSSWSGCRHNLAVASGTSALTVALQSLDLQPGDEILMQTNTFIACWLAAVQNGLKPVLLDLDPQFLGPDLRQLRARTGPRTKALLLTHIGGILTPDLPAIKSFCRENGIYLIEDCAHAHGSHLNGVPAGAWGDIGCFSFHLTKVMTGGEGGMLTTGSDELAEKMVRIKRFGRTTKNPHVFDRLGGNHKMSELTAAFLLTEEKRAGARIERRRQIAKTYHEHLNGSPWKLIWPVDGSGCSFYKVMARGPVSRPELELRLHEKKIQLPNGVYYTPLHRQPVVRQTLPAHDGDGENFPATEAFCSAHFCLPCYPELTDAQVSYVTHSLREIAG